MRLILIEELQEGMVLGEDIMGNYDILLASSGTIVTNEIIETLMKMDIKYVYVFHNIEDNGEAFIINKEFFKEYFKVLDYFKNIYFDARIGKEINIVKLESVISKLVQSILKDSNIIGRLRKIKVNDLYTYKHSIDVCIISTVLGKWLGFNKQKIMDIAIAGLLHDIGKSKISNDILNKPNKLTEEEYEIIKNHPVNGYEIISSIDNVNYDILKGILQHHERIDGNGYPYGLKNEEIHIFAKIISIADVYDAMTSNRSYSNKLSPFKVAESIFKDSFGHLDPYIANTFLKNISQFYVGSKVRLNNGDIGEVVFTNKYDPYRPLIKTSKGFIDLSQDSSFEIIDVI